MATNPYKSIVHKPVKMLQVGDKIYCSDRLVATITVVLPPLASYGRMFVTDKCGAFFESDLKYKSGLHVVE
ncbi:hypothetical protein IC620_15600 [Hazenella sp. IB182357]|uniref:Uncharacterized protein n=1 Tax=Polycladospora coralii TaxID=2771432 RepID=A0A926RUC2_9BACL|nr:hypothetical protein [Polycladospora coralii]MBD1373770.1 hypothetical protein [Polycladospora coralii]